MQLVTTIAPVIVVLLGIFLGILFNQRALDKLESRMESRFERIDARFDRVDRRMDMIQSDLSQFNRILGQHEEAIDTLKKRP